ncbi:MAG TPA: efflux RND transporter periplasmic adaptor subunit [Gemmatimonadaceae bacterium]|nr:efflux RND transporter periplasmic adaptor subunit [Gemmatimonadaceae bacterium]
MPKRLVLPRSLTRLSAALLVLAACRHGGGEEGEGETPAVVGARTTIVRTQPFTESIGAIGSVAPRAGHVATLSAPAAGRVAHVLVAVGAHVQAGQPLVELDLTTFRAASQSAEAALAAAEQSYARTQRLAQEGIAPRKDVEQAAADLARARADVVSAQRAEQLATLRAPIAGVVTRMSATLGGTADPSQPLVEVADPTALDILLGATPTDAARIHAGDKVQLSAGQSAGGEPLGVGTVVDVAGTVDSATRSVVVRVQAPATRRPLRIGETVFGRIAVATRADAIVVPNEALVPEGDGFKVFVVDATGIAHARPVSVGARGDSTSEITRGLTAGERIVTYGAYGVEDSAKVVPLQQAIPKPNDSAAKEQP